MSYRVSLARTAIFAVAYLAAALAGRFTIMDDTNLSMVWPAAGVAVIWFCAQRRAPARWPDLLALFAVALAANLLTGATVPMAVSFALANLAQIAVFTALLRRWRPNLWGADGTEPMRSPRDLWGLLGAAFGATACGAVVGPTARWLFGEQYSATSALVWLARNTASVLVIGAAGLSVGHAVTTYRARYGSLRGWCRHGLAVLRDTPAWRIGEYGGLAVCTTSLYVVGFAYGHRLPLTFAVLGLTVWVATRLSTPFVVVHHFVVVAIAVFFTLRGSGPFAFAGSHALQAILLQVFVTMVAVVGLVLALGRDERNRLMAELAAEKTELAAQEAQASRHAGLMTAIVDSMADGLVVIDPQGRVLIRNPASTALLGGWVSPDGVLTDSGYYGLFRLDGTAYPDAEMAYRRALAGEEVSGEDMLVRNPGVPEGRIVRVNATALPNPDGTRCAVILFHDVTAERRHRDELANFAGVVAHDLINPLSSVAGWTNAALDALEEVPPHPGVDQARADLARLSRAAGRMRVLIDDLLAYTTAREAAVQPAPVSLAETVADIAGARADAAVAGGRPEPRFAIGDLPPVHADPVLVRQLLDNLIGNAIKYTAAGVTPVLRITAEPHDGLVRVCIADNGIGIPDGQHEAIFGNFHRAHAGGAFLGTGLGLAICKRIVERHGGTISAANDPGGGSRFTFTLPAAASAAPTVQILTAA